MDLAVIAAGARPKPALRPLVGFFAGERIATAAGARRVDVPVTPHLQAPDLVALHFVWPVGETARRSKRVVASVAA